MPEQTFYITTPIYYVNAEPHLGHAYSTVVADVAARFHRLLGISTRFQTGTDEHGDKIVQAAEKNGVGPREYVDRISGMFRAAWEPLHIQPDHFIRTTDPEHIAVVRAVLQQVYDAGDIYFDKYGGNYCVSCERFLTDHELVEGKCPDHGTEPQYIEEENYFFRMSKYQDRLVEHIQSHPDFIRPERYKNEVLAMLREPLEDLCISRPKTRLTWGVELPFDSGYVTYVWFDALLNYLTGLGWPDGPEYGRYWPGQHLIAKDILKPHAIYWPTMLMAAGLPLYQHLNVHGYWNVDASKMSKSRGNVVRPLDLAEVYGADAFRYFLMREMTFGLDSNFSQELLVERYNADLANDLGNLFSRVLNMLHKYRQGALPPPGQAAAGDESLAQLFASRGDASGEHDLRGLFHRFQFSHALADIWELISFTNKYIVQVEPWSLAKDPAQGPRLDYVLHVLTQSLASLAYMVWPVMPATAQKMATVLGASLAPPVDWEALCGLRLLPAGGQTQKPEALFPRLETDKVQAKSAKAEAKAAAKADHEPAAQEQAKAPAQAKGKPQPGPAPELTIDEFGRVDLRLGKILEAEPVPKADRLLKLMIDLGEDQPRQVVSGLALQYQPQDLVGRQVVVVANLKPVKLRGVLSRGMVLATVDGDLVRLVGPDQELTPGAKVR